MISTLITAHIAGLIHTARGSGLSKSGGMYYIFSKAPATVTLGLAVYLATGSLAVSLSYFLNFYLVLLLGTGFLMIAFKEKGGVDLINSKDEFKPIDLLLDHALGPVETEADARRYGVWLGTLFGALGIFNFIFISWLQDWCLVPILYGLPILAYGLICGAMRYLGNINVWAIVEYSWAFLYTLCTILAFNHGLKEWVS